MKHYDNLRQVPADALKKIEAGNLKGKSDINPQWRYEAMTREFGTCGVGWKYEIVKTWTHDAPNDQVMVFVEVALYVKDGEEWSSPIPGIGGDFLLEKDKNGLHGNDEAYKMATTDAMGVAMKMLGVAADVYRGIANDSKYGRQQPAQQPAGKKFVEPALLAQLGDLGKRLAMTVEQKKELAGKYGVMSDESVKKMIAELEERLIERELGGKTA